MKVNVVTSFSVKDWTEYGETFIKSFRNHWPKDVHLEILVDPPLPIVTYIPENVTIRALVSEELDAFKTKYRHADGIDGGRYNYRKDAIKFSHKAFAMTEATLDGFSHLIWLDSDVEIFGDVTHEDIESWVEAYEIVHLGRTDIDYSETGFLAFKVSSPKIRDFFKKFRGVYTSGELFNYAQWTDAFVITRMIALYDQKYVKNLSAGLPGLAVFEASPLGKSMKHYKGPTGKAQLFGAGMRYDSLSDFIKLYTPKKIVETGTWNGDRAIQMATAAFTYRDDVTYVGFDLFETATNETDKKEHNVKKHFSLEEVTRKLTAFQTMAASQGKTFKFLLVKGDTNVTLGENKGILKDIDFAFIDGGHSYATVENDFRNLRHSPVVVLDDFYTVDEHGKIPLEKSVNDLLTKEGVKFTVVNSMDRVVDGGLVNLAVVHKEGLPKPVLVKPFRVQPKDCVDKDFILDNVKANMDLIGEWIERCQPHSETAILASGGPSLENAIDDILDLEMPSRLFCVKHSLPTLIEKGITPFGCVLLDPREITGVSTHGKVRTDLFAAAEGKNVVFFVASMSHPSVTRYLLERGHRVVGWHAMTSVLQQVKIPEGSPIVVGGTCAAFRAVGLCHLLGFRRFELFGYDLYYHEPSSEEKLIKAENGLPKYLQVQVGRDKTPFWTSGELIAAAQDAEALFKNPMMDVSFKVHGDGIVATMAREFNVKPLPDYHRLYG